MRARVRTLVYGTFVSFAAAFILLSTREIVLGVFGLRASPESVARAGAPEPRCAEGVRSLAAALERGVVATSAARDEADAVARLRAALAPEWNREAEISAACASHASGSEAWAALQRLKRAEEGAAERHAVLVGPLREDVARLSGGGAKPGE